MPNVLHSVVLTHQYLSFQLSKSKKHKFFNILQKVADLSKLISV